MTTHLSFRQGVQECIPTLLGYAGVGISFGIVASSQNFSILEIILLCLVIYAGAAQFIMCALFIAGTPISAIVLTVFIVNSRMFLLSMSLAPNFKTYGFWNRVGLGSLVTDETFGVAITPYLKGEAINDRWMHGLNITAYLFWVIPCVAGALFGEYISNPQALGLDFAITAMFIFLAIAQFESITKSRLRIYIVLIIAVIVMMLSLSMFMPSYLAILIAATISAALGVMMERWNMLILILLCGIVTLLIRIIPFIMISKVQLPDVVVRWLSFIPITLFTALVIDSIIQQTPHGEGYTLNIPYIIALIPTVILSIITRSLTITIISGIVIMAALRFFF
ncbi:AzlC [Staphylococcus aureus]|nr:AzlC [Staphylococcus aureus]